MSHCVSTLLLFNLAFQSVADRSFLIESKSALSYCFIIIILFGHLVHEKDNYVMEKKKKLFYRVTLCTSK